MLLTSGYSIELPGLKIDDLWGRLNGPHLPQNPLEKVGGFDPHLFQWILRYAGAVSTTQIDDFRPGLGTRKCTLMLLSTARHDARGGGLPQDLILDLRPRLRDPGASDLRRAWRTPVGPCRPEPL